MVSVGSILGGTFRFIRANPRAIAVWAGINIVLSIAMQLVMQPFYTARALQMTNGATPYFSHSGPILLTWLVMILVLIVLYAAVFRAVLFPEQSKMAYLRLGGDELRLLGLIFILLLGWTIGTALFGVVIALIGAAVGVLFSPGRLGLNIAAIIFVLVLTAGIIFVSVRLSLAAPLTLARRKIMIGPAWRLTYGRFWTLFGVYLALWLAALIISLIVSMPMMRPMLSAMAHPGDPTAQQQLAMFQAQQMSLRLSFGGIALRVFGGIFGAIMLAALGGAPAVATVQLLDARGEIV